MLYDIVLDDENSQPRKFSLIFLLSGNQLLWYEGIDSEEEKFFKTNRCIEYNSEQISIPLYQFKNLCRNSFYTTNSMIFFRLIMYPGMNPE